MPSLLSMASLTNRPQDGLGYWRREELLRRLGRELVKGEEEALREHVGGIDVDAQRFQELLERGWAGHGELRVANGKSKMQRKMQSKTETESTMSGQIWQYHAQ